MAFPFWTFTMSVVDIGWESKFFSDKNPSMVDVRRCNLPVIASGESLGGIPPKEVEQAGTWRIPFSKWVVTMVIISRAYPPSTGRLRNFGHRWHVNRVNNNPGYTWLMDCSIRCYRVYSDNTMGIHMQRPHATTGEMGCSTVFSMARVTVSQIRVPKIDGDALYTNPYSIFHATV